MPSKARATSRATVNNLVKIVLADKKKRKRRRRQKRQAKPDATIDLLTSLASKPSMRAVEQPKDDAGEKAQNKLITGSLVATNAGILKALNNLNTPAYSGGYAPPNPLAKTTKAEPDASLSVQGLLIGLGKKKLRSVYKELFNVSLPSGYGDDRIREQILLRNPSIYELEKAINTIHLKDNEPSVSTRKPKDPKQRTMDDFYL